MRKFVFLFLCHVCTLSSYGQIGGGNVFEFLNLNTSPRVIALGGYLNAVIDGDVNNGIHNPSLINSLMTDKLTLNYTNYYTDIFYGDIGYCFNMWQQKMMVSMKFIDHGEFVETNDLGHIIGDFQSGEYVLSVGTSHSILDSLFRVGANTKFAYSSLYELQSSALLVDFALTYMHPKQDVVASLVIKNIGYQITTYHEKLRDPLPFEISLGVSNKLKYMPLRWHLTLQHLEVPKFFDSDIGNDFIENNNSFGYNVLRHIVFGSELLIHKNMSILLGYNNRKRFEMLIPERRALVGFSCGFSIRIHRFNLYYSRASHHYSGPINSFGIVTNFKKN